MQRCVYDEVSIYAPHYIVLLLTLHGQSVHILLPTPPPQLDTFRLLLASLCLCGKPWRRDGIFYSPSGGSRSPLIKRMLLQQVGNVRHIGIPTCVAWIGRRARFCLCAGGTTPGISQNVDIFLQFGLSSTRNWRFLPPKTNLLKNSGQSGDFRSSPFSGSACGRLKTEF